MAMHPDHVQQLDVALAEVSGVKASDYPLPDERISEYLYALAERFNKEFPKPTLQEINEYLKRHGLPCIKV